MLIDFKKYTDESNHRLIKKHVTTVHTSVQSTFLGNGCRDNHFSTNERKLRCDTVLFVRKCSGLEKISHASVAVAISFIALVGFWWKTAFEEKYGKSCHLHCPECRNNVVESRKLFVDAAEESSNDHTINRTTEDEDKVVIIEKMEKTLKQKLEELNAIQQLVRNALNVKNISNKKSNDIHKDREALTVMTKRYGCIYNAEKQEKGLRSKVRETEKLVKLRQNQLQRDEANHEHYVNLHLQKKDEEISVLENEKAFWEESYERHSSKENK